MKNNYIKNILCGILIASVAVASAGCGFSDKNTTKLEDMPIEKADSYSYDIIGGKDVMPIMGFYGPRPNNYSYNANVLPDYYSDEFFDLLNEAGVNLIGTTFTYYDDAPSYVYKLLNQGEKYNIGITIMDNKIYDENLTLEKLDERINNYANYPAFTGLYLVDEPGAPYFRSSENGHNISDFKKSADLLNELECPFYANLLGRLVGSEYDSQAKSDYERYVKEFAETFKPDYLLYDRYIFNENEGLCRDYLHFQNMETVRAQAEESNIPFWVFVQAGSQFNDDKLYFDTEEYFPSRGEFLWMGNTSIAFGAKGIGYFPLLEPYWFAYSKTEPFDFQRNSLIGTMNNKTRWFYYAKDFSSQLSAIDEVLMNAVNKGVIATGDDAEKAMQNNKFLLEENSFRELESVSGNSIVGCFNYKGKTALYVVNYDIEYAQKITLNLKYKCNVEVTQESKVNRYNSDTLTLELGAGDGALIVFK